MHNCGSDLKKVDINKLISTEPLLNEGVINVTREIFRIFERFGYNRGWKAPNYQSLDRIKWATI